MCQKVILLKNAVNPSPCPKASPIKKNFFSFLIFFPHSPFYS